MARKNNRRETYEELSKYFLENPCLDCGEADPIVLEFDHMEKKTKLAPVSELVSRRRPWRIIFEETKKCEERCANSYRKEMANASGYSKLLLLKRTGEGLTAFSSRRDNRK